MKKILLLTAITLFGISAYAQNSTPGETKEKNKDKEQTVRKIDKDDSEVELTREQKLARKADKKAEKAAKRASKEILKADKKADREDDGVINESTMRRDSHGKKVSTIAKETDLEGKAKGDEISRAASSKAENEKIKDVSKEKAVKSEKKAKGKKTRKV